MSSIPLTPLRRSELTLIATLYEAGESGPLDIHSRIVVGPTRRPIPGDTVVWLKLVSRGLVAGENGLMILTELGRAEAEKLIASRTRESVAS